MMSRHTRFIVKLGVALWLLAVLGSALLVGGCSSRPSGDMGDTMGYGISQHIKQGQVRR